MKVSEREISRQMKVSKMLYLTLLKIKKKCPFNSSEKTDRLRIFCNENKRFIRKKANSSPKHTAEKIKAKMAYKDLKLVKKQFY